MWQLHLCCEQAAAFDKCGTGMNRRPISRLTAPECQLSKLGSPETYSIILSAAQSLSETDLQVLEDDIVFYMKTGLIGVRMSWLLTLIQTKQINLAA